MVVLRRDNDIQGIFGLSRGNWKTLRKSVPLHGGERRGAKQDEPAGSRKEGIVPNETTNVAKLGALQQFATAIAANTPELPHLEKSCLQYIEMVGSLQGLSTEQAALVASKQEASKKFKTQLIECQRLASVLRAAIKQHYGIRSEKLAEYNLQPFRGRKLSEKRRSKKKPEPVPAQPEQQTPQA